MGHRVPNHKGKCKNPHGHRYIFEVSVDGNLIKKKGDSSEGMIIDFSDLKKVMIDYIDRPYDHSFMFYYEDKLGEFWRKFKGQLKIHYVDFIPTVENIAKHVFKILKEPLEKNRIKLKSLRVWETPTCSAIYYES